MQRYVLCTSKRNVFYRYVNGFYSSIFVHLIVQKTSQMQISPVNGLPTSHGSLADPDFAY